MPLSREEIIHLGTLARIGLTEEEIQRLQGQLSNILEQFRVLQEVNTQGVEPTGHSVALESVMRPDQPRPSMPVEDVLANAPRREDDLFRVKVVLEE